jgi:hypothetical protein
VARHRLEAYATLTPSRGSGGRGTPSGSIDTLESNDRGAAAQWDGPFPEAARFRDGDGLRGCQGIQGSFHSA